MGRRERRGVGLRICEEARRAFDPEPPLAIPRLPAGKLPVVRREALRVLPARCDRSSHRFARSETVA